tara:strand:- start:168 stop:548 length:381 start_codon:yes stop_codon:yes gene_type:complete
MGIKDEIKSKGFQSEHEKAFVNLIYTASFFESKFSHFIERYDLSPPHYNALRVLRGQHSEGLPRGVLQGRLIHTVYDSTLIIDQLVKRGFVTIVKNSEEQSLALIVITSEGLDLLQELDGKVFDFI